MPTPIKFVIDVLKGELDRVKFEENELKIHTEVLFNEFNHWCDACGIAEQITMQTFSKNLNKIAKSKAIRVNSVLKKGYEFVQDETVGAICVYLKMPNLDILNIE